MVEDKYRIFCVITLFHPLATTAEPLHAAPYGILVYRKQENGDTNKRGRFQSGFVSRNACGHFTTNRIPGTSYVENTRVHQHQQRRPQQKYKNMKDCNYPLCKIIPQTQINSWSFFCPSRRQIFFLRMLHKMNEDRHRYQKQESHLCHLLPQHVGIFTSFIHLACHTQDSCTRSAGVLVRILRAAVNNPMKCVREKSWGLPSHPHDNYLSNHRYPHQILTMHGTQMGWHLLRRMYADGAEHEGANRLF